MRLINIGITDIILQNFEDGQGKIIISDFDFDYNFSYYWGAMGKNTNIEQFLCEINSSYFVDKLSALRRSGDFDAKRTFANFRKHINEEIMQWYECMEFQKDMRESLNNFQRDCYDERQFVQDFDHFCKYTLNYYLIDEYDRKHIEESFTGICEPWIFIVNKPPRENMWLEKLHKKLKRELKKINNG